MAKDLKPNTIMEFYLSACFQVHGKKIPIEYKAYIISAMQKYASQFAEPPMHECKYCGTITDQPDENCYKAPKTNKQ